MSHCLLKVFHVSCNLMDWSTYHNVNAIRVTHYHYFLILWQIPTCLIPDTKQYSRVMSLLPQVDWLITRNITFKNIIINCINILFWSLLELYHFTTVRGIFQVREKLLLTLSYLICVCLCQSVCPRGKTGRPLDVFCGFYFHSMWRKFGLG